MPAIGQTVAGMAGEQRKIIAKLAEKIAKAALG